MLELSCLPPLRAHGGRFEQSAHSAAAHTHTAPRHESGPGNRSAALLMDPPSVPDDEMAAAHILADAASDAAAAPATAQNGTMLITP